MTPTKKLHARIIYVLHHTRGKLLAAIAVSLYLAGLLLWQSNHFPACDPMPTIEQLDAQTLRISSPVTIGLHIHSFPRFSFNQNDFLLDGILWFKYPNGTQTLETLSSFSIHNALVAEHGELLYKSAPIIRLINNDVLACYHIQVQFKATLNHKNFPLSAHRLTIMVQNKTVTPREINFVAGPDQLTIAKDNLVEDWLPRSNYVHTGYVNSPLHPTRKDTSISYPAAIFSIEFENMGTRDLISLYFPMFVLFLITLFCLLIEHNDAARLSYIAAVVPVLVLFIMVIDAVSPHVGYTTHLDFMYNLFVFLSLVILFFQGFVILQLQHVKGESETKQAAQRVWLEYANTFIFFGTLFTLAVSASLTLWR